MNVRTIASVWVVSALLLVGRALGGDAADKPRLVALTSADLKWEPLPNRPAGHMQAPLWGPLDGHHARMIKWPVNATPVPLHKHTADLRIVVVSGTYVYAANGEPEKEYGPGSFISTPGGTPHSARSPAGCVFLEEVDGKFDSIPIPR
jgi:quercetin dioxygenase-like cupin family protein